MDEHKDHQRCMYAQNNAIDKSKYIESQKAQHDLGSDRVAMWWIENFAKDFREAWPKSKCCHCLKVKECKECLKEECPFFEEDTDGQ